MYKIFALIFYIFPIGWLLSILLGKKDGIWYKSIASYLFIILILSYVLFPIIIIIRNFYQIKKETKLGKFFEKYKEKSDRWQKTMFFLTRVSDLFFATFVVSSAFITAACLATYLIAFKYKDTIVNTADSFSNTKTISNKMIDFDNKINTLTRKLHEDKSYEFYENNDKKYTYQDQIGQYSIYNTQTYPDITGFNNKFEYKFTFYLSEAFQNKLIKDNPVTRISSYASFTNKHRASADASIYLFQDDLIKDFYVNSYNVDGIIMPIIQGVVETNTRLVTFFAYPQYSKYPNSSYYFDYLTSPVNQDKSDDCTFYERTDAQITFKCIGNDQLDAFNESYWTIKENASGELSFTKDTSDFE